MDKAWDRLIQIVREPEGVAGGAPNGAVNGGGVTVVTGDDDDDGDDTPDGPDAGKEWENYAKRLRKENATKRTQLRNEKAARTQAEAKIAELNAAHAAALEAARAETKALGDIEIGKAKSAGDQRLIRIEIKRALKEADCKDVDAALTLVDGSVIKVSDAGDVEGVADALAKLKEGKAYLFGDASSSTSSTAKAPGASSAEAKSALKMTNEEYLAHKSAFLKTPLLRRS